MTEPNVGRGRARGRGAELLAAWEASKRRPGVSVPAEPTAVNPPSLMELAEAPGLPSVPSEETAPVPRATVGRGVAALQHLRSEGAIGRSSPVLASSLGSDSPAPAPTTTSHTSGRGMISSLLRLKVTANQPLPRALARSVPATPSPEPNVVAAQTAGGDITTRRNPETLAGTSSLPPMELSTQKAVPEESEKPPVIRKGESGQIIDIEANYLRVSIEPEKGIYEYEVRCDPPIDSKDLVFKVVGQQREVFGPAKTFDGVTMYLPFQFPQQVTIMECKHPVNDTPVRLKVTLRQKRRASDSIHFYNVLFRKIARILGMVQMNRNYFNPHSPIQMPLEKLEIWPGYVTAVNEYEDGLMLCCDVSFRVLRTTTVLDELIEMSRGPKNFQQVAKEVLIGLCVLTRYNNRMYRIDDIVFDKNPMSTFDMRGTPTTFYDYYKNHYGVEIKDKAQPLLLNRMTKKVMGKEDETTILCLVPELCFLTGLDDKLRSNMATMRALATHTRITPMARDQALRKYLESIRNTPKASELLAQWGLRLHDEPLSLQGRRLDPEKIYLGRGVFPTNPQCDWSRNLQNDIINPVRIENWILVSTERDKIRGCEFAECLKDVGGRMGIKINPPRMVSLPNDRTDTYINFIRDAINPRLELAVVLFPTMRDDRYSAVKTLCTAQTAIPSQMINCRTISNAAKLRSVVQKIALQINCKMGGELWAVHIPTKTMMVCGVDVYHDPSRRGQSVVGFLASINPAMTRWYSRSKCQKPGQELVDTFQTCFIECLMKYFQLNKEYPKQIVLFRDGVGEGQLKFVVDHEVSQLLKAFQLIDARYQPKFTMVIVNKRINTRLFMRMGNSLGNPPPGSVVDHTLTKRHYWDFFLVSQHVNQGAVSPTHYIVVHDGGMKPDNLQKLTYKMTHMYYNWPGTIRVPAPCQYAHKLAYLVGQNIRKDVKEELCDRLFFL